MSPIERTPAELKERRRNLITAGGSIVLMGVLASGSLFSLSNSGPVVPPTPADPVKRVQEQANERSWEDAENLVVDVDQDGNLQIDGRPTQIESLRDTLEAWRASAQQVLITIRADERCRYYHLRQLIRVCDDFSVAECKLQPLPPSSSAEHL